MLRIELDDLSRVGVLSLLEEHLRNMQDLSSPDKVFAFDVGKLRAPGVSFWTAWKGEVLLGCAALKEISQRKARSNPCALHMGCEGLAQVAHC